MAACNVATIRRLTFQKSIQIHCCLMMKMLMLMLKEEQMDDVMNCECVMCVCVMSNTNNNTTTDKIGMDNQKPRVAHKIKGRLEIIRMLIN